MTKNSLIVICALIAFSSFAKAEEATIATESAPLKASAGLGGKVLTNLPGGTKVKKLSQSGMWAKVEFTDKSGKVQTGFVSAAAITTGTSVLGNIGKGSRMAVGGAKDALGAAGKGESGASAKAMDGMLDSAGGESAADDEMLDSEEAAPKAASKKSSDHLGSITISEADIVTFMKAGGLQSRLLK